ncbi:hypothetical protein QYE76_014498 [Lolium multiflorum]|uniref:Pentatricopeptide repeat-containing protein n=1 Tax=Lolium multiflorum TaxID=4521 RepID=A0AAD8X5V6_LOLMU|nr:hypothetical protein QYE76_014498 [Lolium multiflorum]
MIGGLAVHGRAKEAVQLFVEMEREGKVKPNGITFVGLLSACCHAGLLEQGLDYFDRMKDMYGIEPRVEHYDCVVDLLGRSGKIGLLTARRSHGDVDTAVLAAERLVELEPDDVGNLVMLANVYAAATQWGNVTGA